MRYLGIDYGHKKVGFAQSDEDGVLAFPLMISENNKDLLRDVKEIVKAMDIVCVVIGESLDLKGKPNPIAKDARAFGVQIENELGVNVAFEKEWFTTAEARKQPEANKNVDDAAAALILQRYLDKVNPKVFATEAMPDEDEE
jgi:putative transcription antitermination factor YqgF